VQVCEWVSAGVKALDKDLIRKSFTDNAISQDPQPSDFHSRLAALLKGEAVSDVSDSDSESESSESSDEVDEVDAQKSERCRRIFFGGEDSAESGSGSESAFEGFTRL
jgi:hypothetical protein